MQVFYIFVNTIHDSTEALSARLDVNGGGDVHLLIENKKAELKSCVTGSVCYGNIVLLVQKEVNTRAPHYHSNTPVTSAHMTDG